MATVVVYTQSFAVYKVKLKRLPLDTGRKLNVHKTFRASSERLMYVNLRPVSKGLINGLGSMQSLCTTYDLKSLIEDTICLKNPRKNHGNKANTDKLYH